MSPVFIILCIMILAGVIAAVVAPFRRTTASDPAGWDAWDDQERADLAVERDALRHALRELDMELAQGRLEREDYERLRVADERRLLNVLDRIEAAAASGLPPATPAHEPAAGAWRPALATGLAVAVLSVGIYGFLQWRTVTRLVNARVEMAGRMPSPEAMVARLEARLKDNPDDVQGQLMAGRSYMAMHRIDAAKAAYTKALALEPRNHEAHYNLGVIMIEQRKFDDPDMFRAAIKHFDVVLNDVPKQPGVNWYKGLALWYLKRPRETEDAWVTAYNNLPPGSRDTGFIKQALAKLRKGETPF